MNWRARAAIALGIGCGSVKAKSPVDAPPSSGDGSTDGPVEGVDAAEPACDLTKPFGIPVQVGGIHDPAANDSHASLTADELTIYFASDRDGTNVWHLYSATRASRSEPFGTPRLLAGGVYSTQGESHPSVSPDGNTIYFDSQRVMVGSNLFTSTRANATVEFPPATMIPGDYLIDPAITADGKVLYAADLSTGRLARLDRGSSGFGSPQTVALPTNNSVVSPVTNDDLTMFLSFGDSTGHSIAVTHRSSTDSGFPEPTVVAELATGASIAEPSWLSPDGCRLYLTYAVANGKQTIYMASRP